MVTKKKILPSICIIEARENKSFTCLLDPGRVSAVFKLTANTFSEEGNMCCLVSVHCLPTLLVHKIVQWLHITWCWLSTFFQLKSATATSAIVGESREKHLSCMSPGQVLTCVAVSVYGYYSLETSVCWVYFFPDVVPHHKVYCQESFNYSGRFCFLLF